MMNTPSPRAIRVAALAMARGGKGFRTPSREELRGGQRSKRGQRREAIRQATCHVVRSQQLVECCVPQAGAILLQARRQLATALAS